MEIPAISIVMMGSRSEYVSAMESISFSGVETMKARAAPLLAPCFLSPVTAGTMSQLQTGIGTPINDA